MNNDSPTFIEMKATKRVSAIADGEKIYSEEACMSEAESIIANELVSAFMRGGADKMNFDAAEIDRAIERILLATGGARRTDEVDAIAMHLKDAGLGVPVMYPVPNWDTAQSCRQRITHQLKELIGGRIRTATLAGQRIIFWREEGDPIDDND